MTIQEMIHAIGDKWAAANPEGKRGGRDIFYDLVAFLKIVGKIVSKQARWEFKESEFDAEFKLSLPDEEIAIRYHDDLKFPPST